MDFNFGRKRIIGFALAFSLGMALVFGAYTAVAFSSAPSTTTVSYETLYEEKGEVSHKGFFTNETVYDNGTPLEYYPEKITQRIEGVYSYSSTPERPGTYSAVLRADYYVVSNKKRIYLSNTTLASFKGKFDGTFTLPLLFNMSDLTGRLSEVREGTGLYRASADTYFLVKVSVPGREPFTQRISLVRDASGMLKLDGAAKSNRKVERHVNTTTNTVGFLGKDVAVSTGRKVFPAMALVFAFPPAGFLYGKREKKPKDELKGIRKFIVEGTPPERGGNAVILESSSDLEGVFDLVDRPVVHYTRGGEDVYSISDGDEVYEYRVPRRE